VLPIFVIAIPFLSRNGISVSHPQQCAHNASAAVNGFSAGAIEHFAATDGSFILLTPRERCALTYSGHRPNLVENLCGLQERQVLSHREEEHAPLFANVCICRRGCNQVLAARRTGGHGQHPKMLDAEFGGVSSSTPVGGKGLQLQGEAAYLLRRGCGRSLESSEGPGI